MLLLARSVTILDELARFAPFKAITALAASGALFHIIIGRTHSRIFYSRVWTNRKDFAKIAFIVSEQLYVELLIDDDGDWLDRRTGGGIMSLVLQLGFI